MPWRGGCSHRHRAWNWVKARYRERHPDWPIVISGTSEGPWVKADAVMPAVQRAPDDVVVVADADVWCDGLESAVRAVTAGAAEWAMPHTTVYRLTEEATEAWLTTDGPGGPNVGLMHRSLKAPDESQAFLQTERRPYEGVWGGGIVVAHRDTFLRVPLDPRFKGPGQEDEAWGVALATLAGPGWRGTADLIHLHHPPLPRLSARRGSVESWELYRRYLMANRNPEAMKALLEEIDTREAWAKAAAVS